MYRHTCMFSTSMISCGTSHDRTDLVTSKESVGDGGQAWKIDDAEKVDCDGING